MNEKNGLGVTKYEHEIGKCGEKNKGKESQEVEKKKDQEKNL